MYDDGEEEEEDDEDEERADGDESEDLYESDVSLAEDMDEQEEKAEPAGGASASDDQDAGAWEAGPAGGGARGAPALRRGLEEEEEEEEEEGEEASYEDEDEEFSDDDDDDDALLAAQGLRRRQEAGALTARQRALHAPVGDTLSPEAAARVSKRKLRDDGPDAALRREAAKARVRQQKEEQLMQAREAATAKILSGDTSRKRQAAKAQKVQEDRLAERRANRHPQPGFVRMKRGPAGSVVEFAPGEGPYWVHSLTNKLHDAETA